MRYVPYVLYLLLIAFYRTNLIDIFSIGAIHIYLTALIVLLVALNKDYLTALWFAFVAGLVYDAPDPIHLGVHMILLSLLSIAASRAKERLNVESLKSRLVLIVCGLTIYAIPETLIYATSGSREFFRVFFHVALPGVVYTAMVGWVFFLFQTGRISWTKLKSIF